MDHKNICSLCGREFIDPHGVKVPGATCPWCNRSHDTRMGYSLAIGAVVLAIVAIVKLVQSWP